MAKKILAACLVAFLIPYVVTLAWTGSVEGKETAPQMVSGKRIVLERDGASSYIDVEEYLTGAVAKQIPADYGQEALRAQAIIARTYIYKQMEGGSEIAESALDMDYLEEKQMEKLWGNDRFMEYFNNIEQAVRSTGKMTITYDGGCIDPLFHRASTGRTRAGDENHLYLSGVDSARDVEAEDFLHVSTWTKEEFAQLVSSIPDAVPVTAGEVPQTVQVIEKDEAGYIKQIQIGSKTYTGEEVQYALGLPSASYTLEDYNGKIRAVSSGIGHGYGLSQYGAKVKAEEGWKAEDILAYFYKNIVIISE